MNSYRAAPFFFLRQATISNEDLQGVLSNENQSDALFDYYENSSHFQLAVAIASPSLYQSLKSRQFLHNEKKRKQIYHSLLKYFLRAASRTTPFGLFASIGYGEFQERARLSNNNKVVKKIKPDMTWLSYVTKKLTQEALHTQNFKIAINPGVILKGNKFYLIQISESKEETPELLTIAASSYTKHILSICASPIEYQILIEQLVEKYGQEERVEIEKSVTDMLKKRFLLSEFTPTVREPDFLKTLTEKIKSFSHVDTIRHQLIEVQHLCKECEDENDQKALQRLEDLYKILQHSDQLPYPVQADTMKKGISYLPSKLLGQIEVLPELLLSFSNPTAQNKALEEFKRNFLEKFGTGVLVPLQEAIRCIEYTASPVEDKTSTQKSPLDSLLIESVSPFIELSDEFVRANLQKLDKKRFPRSCEIFFEILCPSIDGIDSDHYTIVVNPHLATNQAGASLGRFLYLFEETIYENIKSFLKEEEKLEPGVVFVEAGFLPLSARTGNVATFKPVKEYYLGFEYLPNSPEFLSIEDIHLVADLHQIHIFSKKLNKKLSVSLSTAVNDTLAPLPLKLLLEITKDNSLEIHPFIWSTKAKEFFLPEVRYKNIILSPRRWLITEERLKQDQSILEKKDKLKKFFTTCDIPEQVLLCLYDHRLKLNWKIEDNFAIIYQQFCSKGEVILFESLHEKLGLPFGTKDDHFHTEVAVSLMLNESSAEETNKAFRYAYRSLEKRTLGFHSGCLYVKIYLPQNQETAFLKESVVPLINELTQKELLSYWFFIRYHESKPHIRLRLFFDQERATGEILHQFSATMNDWLEKETVNDASLHLYERELERYGGTQCIEAVEKFFCVDSILTIQILQRAENQNEYPLFSLASISILMILQGFFKETQTCLDFLARAKIDPAVLSGVRSFYKPLATYAANIIASEENFQANSILVSLIPIFFSLQKYASELSEEVNKVGLSKERIEMLVDSLIHMHCNRLLGINNELEQKSRGLAQLIVQKVIYLKEVLHVS